MFLIRKTISVIWFLDKIPTIGYFVFTYRKVDLVLAVAE